MATYFSEAFTRDELKKTLEAIFGDGMEAYEASARKMRDRYKDIPGNISCAEQIAKYKAVQEYFDTMLEWHMPSLDETTSNGPVQNYLKLKKGQNGKTR